MLYKDSMGDRVHILIDTPAVALRYYSAKRIVHHEFKQFVRGEQFRSVLETGLQWFQKHAACKWLSDDRGNTAITPGDADWALTQWAPRVIAAGWKYWAVVMPENTIGQMNMKRWIQTYADQGVTARAFTDPREAMRWLEVQGGPASDLLE
jgi:hypothetical protein